MCFSKICVLSGLIKAAMKEVTLAKCQSDPSPRTYWPGFTTGYTCVVWLNPGKNTQQACKWASAACWKVQFCSGFSHFHFFWGGVTSVWSSERDPAGGCMCWSEKRDMKQLDIQPLHTCLYVQWLREHKWTASCQHDFTSSFFMYKTIEWAVALKRKVITFEQFEWGSYKPQEKPFAEMPASSGGPHAWPWIIPVMGFFSL